MPCVAYKRVWTVWKNAVKPIKKPMPPISRVFFAKTGEAFPFYFFIKPLSFLLSLSILTFFLDIRRGLEDSVIRSIMRTLIEQLAFLGAYASLFNLILFP